MKEEMPVLREKKVRHRGSRKLLLIIFLLFVVLLAVLFFRSPISKISEIRIQGNHFATTEQIKQIIGVAPGDQFFGTSSGTLEDRIKTLQPVEDVAVDKQFPGLVTITVKEYKTVAFEMNDGTAASPKGTAVFAILANGASVPVQDVNIVLEMPILTKWTKLEALKAELCKQLAAIPEQLLADISEIQPIPSQAYPDRIKLYTRSKFEVITAISLLKEKIIYIGDIIERQKPGVITMLEANTHLPYTPQEPDGADGENNGKSSEKGTTQ